MEYRRDDDTRSNPWPWVAIIVGILIFLTAAWWIAGASSRDRETVLLPPDEPERTEPAQPSTQPTQPDQTTEPTVTERQPPVNIYVQRTPEQPNRRPVIVVVPEGQQPPRSDGMRLSEVDVPAEFRYQGSVWQASDQATSPDPDDLVDTGANIEGKDIYAERNDRPPYDTVYVETEPDSGVFVRYTKRP